MTDAVLPKRITEERIAALERRVQLLETRYAARVDTSDDHEPRGAPAVSDYDRMRVAMAEDFKREQAGLDNEEDFDGSVIGSVSGARQG